MELVRGVPAVSREDIGRLANPPEPEPASQTAVRKAISSMCTRYFDPITLTEIASEVFVSPFHFSRIFARTVGLTPGRYLTALRLFEAKRLLLSTSLTVSDVVCSVGYSSVGTFTNRFTKAVGMTPTQYRDPEVRDLLVALAPHYQRLPPADALENVGESEASVGPGDATITGRVSLPHWAPPADTLVGAFAEEVPQSGPAAFTVLRGSQSPRFTIRGVPDGRWTVIAMAAHATPSGPRFSFGTTGRLAEVSASRQADVRVRMRGLRITDPPIAITLAGRPSPTGLRTAADSRPHLRAAA